KLYEVSNIEISYEAASGNEILVEADNGKIVQVLSNLLTNAIKFTREGKIKLGVEVENSTGQVVISVKDNGDGIDFEILPQLFTKFATKSDKGMGLGLYISKSIVEAHGGRIWATNNEGEKGATFSFSLNLAKMNGE
ncbi:MAG: HAMP domain-containing histidine kinase, partial [Thaumarchaeota archaeon]